MLPQNENRNEGTFGCSPGASVRSHVPPERKPERGHILSVATPAEPRGGKKNFFLCKFWAVKNFLNLLKSAGEILLSGLRGAKHFSNTFRIVFRILFRVFQTVFRIDLKVSRGQFRSADMPP